MKIITFPELKSDEFKNILGNMIGNDPSGGYTAAEVGIGMQILDKLPSTGASVRLEDAEYELIQARLARAKFGAINVDVATFVEALSRPTGAAT